MRQSSSNVGESSDRYFIYLFTLLFFDVDMFYNVLFVVRLEVKYLALTI